MQAVIFCGIQASGKSTFYREQFFRTHLRISLDQLRTRHRENRFLQCCLQTMQRFVVDNTNPTAAERQKYIALAKQARFEVVGYYFETTVAEAIERNSSRSGKEFVPVRGIYGTSHKLQAPAFEEGFDRLFTVRLRTAGRFDVEEKHPGPPL